MYVCVCITLHMYITWQILLLYIIYDYIYIYIMNRVGWLGEASPWKVGWLIPLLMSWMSRVTYHIWFYHLVGFLSFSLDLYMWFWFNSNNVMRYFMRSHGSIWFYMNDQLTTWMSKRHIPSVTAMVMSAQALAGPPATTRTTAWAWRRLRWRLRWLMLAWGFLYNHGPSRYTYE